MCYYYKIRGRNGFDKDSEPYDAYRIVGAVSLTTCLIANDETQLAYAA